MFEQSLIESRAVAEQRPTWTTIVSFALQSLCVCLLIIAPFAFPEALPIRQLIARPLEVPPAAPAPAPPKPVVEHTQRIESNLFDNRILQPRRIPDRVQQLIDDEPPPQIASGTGVEGMRGLGPGTPGGVLNSVLQSLRPPTAHPDIAPPRPRSITVSSGVQEGLLIHQVKPIYPPIARQARIQGAVVLHAMISKEGTIESLQVLSGHPMLAPAAIDAVRQWRYRPYMLNREPVEVETQITVNFILGG